MPFLYPILFLISGTNKELIATKTLVAEPINANSEASIKKLWKKNKFINGIVRPAPTAIINVGITALKITNQLKEFFLLLFISKRLTLSTFTLNKK